MLFDRPFQYYYNGKLCDLKVAHGRVTLTSPARQLATVGKQLFGPDFIRLQAPFNTFTTAVYTDDIVFSIEKLKSGLKGHVMVYPVFYEKNNQEIIDKKYNNELSYKFFTVNGEMLLRFKKGETPSLNRLKDQLKASQFEFKKQLRFKSDQSEDIILALYRGNDAFDYFEQMNRLSKDPRVAYAQPNFINSIQLHSTIEWGGNPYFTEQWAINHNFSSPLTTRKDIRWIEAQQLIAKRELQNVNVAILDEGIDKAHTDLIGSVSIHFDTISLDPDPEMEGEPLDELNSHGTAIAGIIRAVDNNKFGIVGINEKAQLQNIRISYTEGGERYSTTSATIEGIRAAIRDKARVLNISWSDIPNDAVRDAIRDAVAANIVVCCSAGNARRRISPEVVFPASMPEVISVGAVNDQGKVAREGVDGCDFTSCHQGRVDVYAPGMNIVTTKNNGGFFHRFSGTSAATAFVSGVVSILLGLNSKLDTTTIKKLLAKGDAVAADHTGATPAPGYPRRLNVEATIKAFLALGVPV
jgi:Subtilase family